MAQLGQRVCARNDETSLSLVWRQTATLVLGAILEPGDKTVFDTHRFPVILYVLEGAFT